VAYVGATVGGSYFELPAQVKAYGRVFQDVHDRSTPMKEYQP
jgi:hypothetical protein